MTTAPHDPHSLDLQGVNNLRDLGGLPLAQGGRTTPGRLWRGDALRGLTAADRAVLARAGLRHVVDLRAAEEAARAPNPADRLPHVLRASVPLYDGLAPLEEMARDLGDSFDMASRYLVALDSCGPNVARVLNTIAGIAAPGAVLVHCTLGKDRTGLIVALLLRNAGVPRDAVIADFARTASAGAPLLAQMREMLVDRGTDPTQIARILAAPPEAMARVLDWLDATHGGVEGYLDHLGIRPETRARLALWLQGSVAYPAPEMQKTT